VPLTPAGNRPANPIRWSWTAEEVRLQSGAREIDFGKRSSGAERRAP
jgi:hypothetical protein